MRAFKREDVQPQTAEEAVRESYRNPELQQLYVSLIGGKPPTRREDMTAALLKLIDGDMLEVALGNASHRERAMIAQAAWSDDGFFDRDRFKASYGKAEETAVVLNDEDDADDANDNRSTAFYRRDDSRKRTRTWVELIMPQGVLARELQVRLRKLLPEPVIPTIHGVDILCESVDQKIQTWNPSTRSYDEGIEKVPVEPHVMETSALREVLAALRLIDAGKVTVSDKNHTPTPGAIQAVGAVLNGGDFYPEKEEPKKSDDDYGKPGAIRAFAWPMLLQAAKLARAKGSRLELTPAGRAALLASPGETLRDVWRKWIKSDLFDEFRRVDFICGQTGNGKRGMTRPTGRREAIAAALQDCPVGQWITIAEFSRHLRAAAHEFEVSTNPWSLYIGELQYGSLGYDGSGGWNILQLRYLLCLLLEYAATLGVVDVSLLRPNGARNDFRGMWGTDDLPFLSRYDGLMHLRLTELGAYILGVRTEFELTQSSNSTGSIVVSDDLEIAAVTPLSAGDVMLLETFAVPVKKDVWKLDQERILDAEAAGRSVEELTAYLESAGGVELPATVADFFADLSRRTEALRDGGPARLIHCADASLAHFIANHPETAKRCSLAGPDRLVIADTHRSAFDRALKKLGFVVRRKASEQ